MVGLRTGFCGSLTTFASWELSLVSLLIGGKGYQGGQWAEFLWGFVIGFQLSLSSYMFGAHLAANLDAFFMAPLPKYRSSSRPKQPKNTNMKHLVGKKDTPGRAGQGPGGQANNGTAEPGQIQPHGPGAGDAGWDLEERGQLEGRDSIGDGWNKEEQGDVKGAKICPPSDKEARMFRKVGFIFRAFNSRLAAKANPEQA